MNYSPNKFDVARMEKGEICQRCGSYVYTGDRQGEGRQTCVRCRLASLERAEPIQERPKASELEPLVQACQWVVDHGICDDRSRSKLTEALKFCQRPKPSKSKASPAPQPTRETPEPRPINLSKYVRAKGRAAG